MLTSISVQGQWFMIKSAKRVVEYLVAFIVKQKDSEASITSELVVSSHSSVTNNILDLYSVPKLHQILALFITFIVLGGPSNVGEVLQSFPRDGRATIALPAGIELVIVTCNLDN